MIKTRDTFGTFTLDTTPRNRAEARGLRRAVALTLAAATVFAVTALTATDRPAAMERDMAGDAAYVVAYADLNADRFGDVLDGIFPEDDGHALNDAWMGMRVISADGVLLGYVGDAFVDEDGAVDELVIDPAGEESPLFAPVSLPARYARLGAEAVKLSLGATQAVATLTPATDFDRLGEQVR